MADRPNPYVPKAPGDIIYSGDWNELQIQAREELDREVRGLRVDGEAIRGEVDELMDKLKGLDTKTADLKNRVETLDAGKLALSGGTISGDLAIKGALQVVRDITYEGKLSKLDASAGGAVQGDLSVKGVLNTHDGNPYAVTKKFMAAGSLTIGSIKKNYGGGKKWTSNTAGLLLEALDNTEIAVHDSGKRVASLMYYEGGAKNHLTIGRDMGWGPIAKTALNGNLEIKGVISAKNALPIRQQMVHRRIIYGYAGDAVLGYSTKWKPVRSTIYGPFGYAVPAIQPGAVRKYRLYAIYSDTMSTAGEHRVQFVLADKSVVPFKLGRTFGQGNPYNRDGFSDWHVGGASTSHGKVNIRTTVAGGVLYYLELQTWDFF